MGISISTAVRQKLATKHSVTEDEVIECFSSRIANGKFLKDSREEHQTNPPSLWFIGTTDAGRRLKVVFIYCSDSKEFVIKTAYEANGEEVRIYKKYS